MTTQERRTRGRNKEYRNAPNKQEQDWINRILESQLKYRGKKTHNPCLHSFQDTGFRHKKGRAFIDAWDKEMRLKPIEVKER